MKIQICTKQHSFWPTEPKDHQRALTQHTECNNGKGKRKGKARKDVRQHLQSTQKMAIPIFHCQVRLLLQQCQFQTIPLPPRAQKKKKRRAYGYYSEFLANRQSINNYRHPYVNCHQLNSKFFSFTF